MSNRLNLRISVILIVLGIGLIPTAYLISGYMRDQANAEIPRTLLLINDGATKYIEDNYIGVGIPELLEEIKDDQINYIDTTLVRVGKIPFFALMIRENMLDDLPELINSSGAARKISDLINVIVDENSTTEAFARREFFNNYTLQDNYSTSLEGISEYSLGSTTFNFTNAAVTRILDGYNDYPGLIEDPELGLGVLDWLEFYDLAEANISDNRSLMEGIYNCTWRSGQLQNVSNYIKSYLWDTIIKAEYFPTPIDEYALNTFYAQWANLSFYNNRLELNLFIEPLNTSVSGIEVFFITNLDLNTSKNLWNSTNPLSFTNESGIFRWFESFFNDINATNEIRSEFGITPAQTDAIEAWLFLRMRNTVLPQLSSLPKPYGFGMTIPEYSESLFLDQWANGTLDETGFELDGGIKGFEVGIPTKTNISLEIAKSLFDTTNSSAFINLDGILSWVKAEQGDLLAENDLINTFKLSGAQFNLILTWLFTTFKDDVLPNVLTSITGRTLYEIAYYATLRQWAFGNIFESGINLSNYSSSGLSFEGWEIGIPTAIDLNFTQLEYLWDSSNALSFVNRRGISIWLKSIENQDYYNQLTVNGKGEFNLTNTEYLDIYNWLIYTRNNFVLSQIQIESLFDVDIDTLSELYQMGILIGGIVFIAAGICFGVLGYFRRKR
ncbi:MAG: hypothetical protein ACFE8E_10520 [Candidatus Hodarchaeota archaeon]